MSLKLHEKSNFRITSCLRFISCLIAGCTLYTTLTIPAKLNYTNFSLNDVRCLAETIYHEARGEPRDGQYAVAWVTINRSRPFKLCEAVFAKGQYPWTKKHRGWHYDKGSAEVAIDALSNPYSFTAMHFHNIHVDPKWKLKKLTQIGNHIFYE